MNQAPSPSFPRVSWLDAAKGLGIVFVVMGHVVTNPPFRRLIYTFHMPLFFFLSGIAFSFSRKEGFLSRRAASLLVPYFVFSLATFFYWFFLERRFRPPGLGAGEVFLTIFLAQGGKYEFNAVMWFLPCLFVIETAFFFLHRKIRSNAVLLGAAACCFIAGCALSGAEPFPASFRLPLRLPWLLDTAMLGIFFYALGSMSGNFLFAAPSARSAPIWAIALAGLACWGVSVFFPHLTELSLFIIPPAPVFVLGAFAGIVAVLMAARRFSASWLQWLGRISLIVMCINEPVKRVVLKLSASVSGVPIADMRAGIWSSVCMTALTLGVCVLLAVPINRGLSLLLGKFRRRPGR